jgi:hypothetical protein
MCEIPAKGFHSMANQQEKSAFARRTALAGLGAGSLGLALGTRSAGAAPALSTAVHPLTGVWLAMANPARAEDPKFPVPSVFAADGTVVLNWVPAEIGMDGQLQFLGSYGGIWEPYEEHTGHFTAVQSMADPTGKFVGTVTVDGHPHVSEDGLTFVDDGSLNTVTICDAAGAVVSVVPPGTPERPITGTKMRVGNPGFSVEEDATPIP